MKITVNLATRPYADQGPAIKNLRIGMLILAGVLVLLGFGWFHFHERALAMQAQEDRQDAAIARIRQEQAGYQRQMQQPLNARVLEQAVFLNGLFEEKSFSWTAAMEDLERVLPVGVQVTAIEPVRAKDGRLTLRLRISGLRERSVDMVKNMERSPRFASPRISGENADTSQNQNQVGVRDAALVNRVSFDLLAEYNPATLDERKAELAGAKRHKAEVTAPAAGVSVVRPGYIAPNPQPVGLPRVIPPRPRMVPGQPQQMPQRLQQPMVDPSGYDESGLKNHDRNRVPPANPVDGDPK